MGRSMYLFYESVIGTEKINFTYFEALEYLITAKDM